MAACISAFSPSIDEGRWVSQGSRALASELILEMEDFSPTIIFQVPKSLSETNPEAYTPLLLGMGPYHHLRPDLHAADRQKLVTLNKFLAKNPTKDFSKHFLQKMRDLGPLVRASYDRYLDLECSTLDYILAVDSFYLLGFLGLYGPETHTADFEPGRQELAMDILKLENQIPAFAVKEMGKELGLFSAEEEGIGEKMLYSQLFYYICKAHSPLKLVEVLRYCRHESSHLLAHMYYLVVNNTFHPIPRFRSRIREVGTEALTTLGELGLGGEASIWIKPILLALSLVQVVENSMLADEITKIKLSKPPKKSHQIPSVSELSKTYNIGFELLERKGIRDIRFDLEDIRPVYLPEITLKCDSEVVLRNLVAYESSIATQDSAFELAGYIDLMSSILQTSDDVEMLRESGIIKGRLDDGEVVEIFNGIGKSVGNLKPKEECASRKVVKQVKEMVEEWEKRNVWKRLWKCVEKKVKNGVELTRKPVGIGLKGLLYLFMAMLLVLQIMQAYCQVYGCNKGGSEAKAMSFTM